MQLRPSASRSAIAPGSRHRGLLGGAVLVVVALAVPALPCRPADGRQPAAAKGGAVDDDPFADELNPFGTGKAGTPAAAAPAPAPRPPVRPPVRPESDRSEEPRPAARARPRPKLPVPFPEAPAEGGASRDGVRGRTDGPSRPGAARPRSAPDAADAWIDQTDSEKLLAQAEKLEQAGKLEEARDLLRQVVDKEPKLVVGHLALGVVLRRLGDFRGSVQACTKGIEIDPQEPELYLRRGIAWFHQGLYGIALEDFEEAAGIAYEDPRPELWRGLTLMELERPLEAINAYASAIRRDRSFMLAYLNRGLAYLDTGEPGKAEFDFNQAIRQRPKDARVWFNRGVAQARQGRFAEAVYSYETALGIEPGNADTRRNLEAARGMAGRAPRRTQTER
jgi:Flp pilus assembly protein TadD